MRAHGLAAGGPAGDRGGAGESVDHGPAEAPGAAVQVRVRMRGACRGWGRGRPPRWCRGARSVPMCRCPRRGGRALVTSSDTTRTTVSAASGATAGCRKPSRKARAASRASATAPVERALVALTVIMFIRVTLVRGSSMPGLRLPDPRAPPLHPPTGQSHSACRSGLRTTVDAWPHAAVRPCHDRRPTACPSRGLAPIRAGDPSTAMPPAGRARE